MSKMIDIKVETVTVQYKCSHCNTDIESDYATYIEHTKKRAKAEYENLFKGEPCLFVYDGESYIKIKNE